MTFALRKWQPDDAQTIAVAADNPNIAANLRDVFPHPYSADDARWFVNDCIAHEGSRQMTRAIIVGGRAVGSIGVFIQDDVYQRSGELGYWLSESYWNQGITSACVQQICRDAFSAFDIARIFAEPFDCNIGSRRVLEKAGFTCEGTMRNSVYKNGKILSYCMYSILREEMNP